MKDVPADQRVGLEPYLFRDVFWCWSVNEPFMLSYQDDHPRCSLCGWDYGTYPDEAEAWRRLQDSAHSATGRTFVELPADFLGGPGHHPFVCHVLKPTWAYSHKDDPG